MQAMANDTLVEVRREWNDGATATYRLDAISGWSWHFVGGRMQAGKAGASGQFPIARAGNRRLSLTPVTFSRYHLSLNLLRELIIGVGSCRFPQAYFSNEFTSERRGTRGVFSSFSPSLHAAGLVDD